MFEREYNPFNFLRIRDRIKAMMVRGTDGSSSERVLLALYRGGEEVSHE